jgi:hypothetical protein
MQTKLVHLALPFLAASVGAGLLAGCASLEAPKGKSKSAAEVPAAVRQAFQARFPAVRSAEWKRKSDQNYEAEFTLKAVEIAAKFDSGGKWLETESAIDPSKVPQRVQEAIAHKFNGYKTVETQIVERPNEERQIYELHLENAQQIVKAQFDADGAILNQSTKPKPAKEK